MPFLIEGRMVSALAFIGFLMGATTMEFTMYSLPIKLRYGEVYNTMQDFSEGDSKDHMFPPEVIARYWSGEKDMALKGFTLDVIRKTEDGREFSVKLSDHYLHHYILYFGEASDMQKLDAAAKKDKHVNHMLTSCHGMSGGGLRMVKGRVAGLNGVSFGSAAGAEFRHNRQQFQTPYRLMLHKPEAWLPTFHLINTKKDNHTVSPLLECPCTPQRKIDPENGTIDGHEPEPAFGCSPAFAKTGNPSCSLYTYHGGWRCCEHKVFLIDTDKECRTPDCSEKPMDKIFMKFQFEYEDSTEETRDIEGAACCDTTSDHKGSGNIEHDVVACPVGTPPDQCIFVTESVQPIGWYYNYWPGYYKGWELVDLVLASPHLHWAGLSLELIDHETNETLCEVNRSDSWNSGVMYGTGNEPGNEKGYLVGLTPCTWSGKAPKRFRRDHLFRSRSVYNATTHHFGVMSLWLTSVSAVPETSKDDVVV